MSEAGGDRGRWLRVFVPVWTGQAASLLGSQIASFAVVWWITIETGSGTALALATVAALLPAIFIGPIAGAYVDRWDRRTVMIAADAASALGAALLALLFLTGAIELWHVYAVTFARSLSGAFHMAAVRAATTFMVPEAQYGRVAGLNQMLNASMLIIAPPAGALLLAIWPLHALMLLDVATACCAIAPLLFVRIANPVRAADAPITHVLQDFRDGLRYVAGWRGMMLTIAISVVINFLLNPAFSLVPLLVTQHFGGGALQLSYMTSAMSARLLAGGAVLTAWTKYPSRVAVGLTGVVGMGAATLIPGFATPAMFWFAVGGMFVIGFFNAVANTPMTAMLQSIIAPHMQGRVFALVMALCQAASPIGLMIGGPLADLIGPQFWFQIGGAACLLMGAAAFFSPSIMNIERDAPGARTATVAE